MGNSRQHLVLSAVIVVFLRAMSWLVSVRPHDHMYPRPILHEANLKTLKRRSGVSNDRSFALQDLVDSVFERPVLVGRSKCISCCSEQVSSDLPRLWIGVDEDSDGKAQKKSQHAATSCCWQMRWTIDLLIPRARAIVPYPSPAARFF